MLKYADVCWHQVFEPYAALWTNTAAFAVVEPTWMHGTFDKLDAAAMSESISNGLKYIYTYIQEHTYTHTHTFYIYIHIYIVCVYAYI
jgi:hypothetical protein